VEIDPWDRPLSVRFLQIGMRALRSNGYVGCSTLINLRFMERFGIRHGGSACRTGRAVGSTRISEFKYPLVPIRHGVDVTRDASHSAGSVFPGAVWCFGILGDWIASADHPLPCALNAANLWVTRVWTSG
jgi:hypothetical protein